MSFGGAGIFASYRLTLGFDIVVVFGFQRK